MCKARPVEELRHSAQGVIYAVNLFDMIGHERCLTEQAMSDEPLDSAHRSRAEPTLGALVGNCQASVSFSRSTQVLPSPFRDCSLAHEQHLGYFTATTALSQSKESHGLP